MKNTIKICFVLVFTLLLSNLTEAQNITTSVEKNSTVVKKTSPKGEKTKQVITDNRKSPKIKGSGKIATEPRKAEGNFEKISSQTLLEVIIEQADNHEIIVEADDNIIPYIVTEISSNRLKIYFDKVSITNFKQAKVYVKLPKISELSASSSSSITTDKAIRSNNLNLEANSSGDIILSEVTANSVNIDATSSSDIIIEKVNAKDLNIEGASSGDVVIKQTQTPKITISASSSSDIVIKGETKDLKIKASSAADVKTKDLSADNVTVSASSSSSVSVYPNISLDARASSTGSIYYYNKPQTIDKETSSMGTIKQR